MPRRNHRQKQTPQIPAIGSGVSACLSKQRYLNKLAATRAAELKNLEDTALDLTVYRCDNCHKWHLTRQNRDL